MSRADKYDWTGLFDTAELEHVVELVRGEIKIKELGGEPKTYLGIRNIFLPMLEQYTQVHYRPDARGIQVNIEAANNLHTFAVDMAKRIEAGEIQPADPDEFERLWRTFISEAAGYFVYDQLPKQSERNKRNAAKPRARKLPPGAKLLKKKQQYMEGGDTEREAHSRLYKLYHPVNPSAILRKIRAEEKKATLNDR